MLATIIVALAGLFAGLIGAGWLAVVEWGAWTLVAPGRRWDRDEGAGDDPNWGAIAIEGVDGARLEADWKAAGAGRTAIVLHGFAEDRRAMRGRAQALAELGWDVLVPDGRGCGRSGGEFATFGAREAADLAAWIGAVGPGRLAVWGRSMGAAVAVRAAAEGCRVDALVLEAPFADLHAVVAAWLRQVRVPGVLAGGIIRRAGRIAGVDLGRPGPIEAATRVGAPALILLGRDDPLIPPREAARLAAAFPHPAEVIEVPGARHADVADVGGPALVARVAAFLDRAIPHP